MSRPYSPPSPPRRPRTPTPPSSPAFVWRKKAEQDRKRGLTIDSETRRRDLQRELQDAKRRRLQRERERYDRETRLAADARQREAAHNHDWHSQTLAFDATQHFLRQAIRITHRREKPLDALAKFIRVDLGGALGVLDVQEVVRGMGERELEEVVKGVESELRYLKMFDNSQDTVVWNEARRRQFWLFVRACLAYLLGSVRGEFKDGVHALVEDDVEGVLKRMDGERLVRLEGEIEDELSRGDGEVDFWASVLKKVKFMAACWHLRQISIDLIPERKKRQDTLQRRKIEAARDDDMVRREKEKGMAEDEEVFDDEIEVKSEDKQDKNASYAWNDKYRPRKPKYYNRVYTGFNWTKYNRTHYDHDNPPPKTVQGYKFNIFYPDLIDATKTPSYHVRPTDNPDVCIITFKAGPPYEDLAFKIVNRPWEKSHRRGYRCSFDRGVLQLWFHLQKYRYRR